jgi:hypothetical protein
MFLSELPPEMIELILSKTSSPKNWNGFFQANRKLHNISKGLAETILAKETKFRPKHLSCRQTLIRLDELKSLSKLLLIAEAKKGNLDDMKLILSIPELVNKIDLKFNLPNLCKISKEHAELILNTPGLASQMSPQSLSIIKKTFPLLEINNNELFEQDSSVTNHSSAICGISF